MNDAARLAASVPTAQSAALGQGTDGGLSPRDAPTGVKGPDSQVPHRPYHHQPHEMDTQPGDQRLFVLFHLSTDIDGDVGCGYAQRPHHDDAQAYVPSAPGNRSWTIGRA